VKELEAAMLEAQIISPIEGNVIAAVDPGQSVRTTTTAFVIGDIDQLEIRAEVGEELLGQLIENMPVRVILAEQPEQTLSGIIWRLPYPFGSGSSDNNDESVRIRLDEPPSVWRVGGQAHIMAVLGQKLDTLWLPPEAIRSAGGRTFVFMQTDAGPKQVNITTGVETRDRVEILEGLSQGQVVIGP
jgi:multidrug efflux pump subunit AcrA (membrane-fusion protein)